MATSSDNKTSEAAKLQMWNNTRSGDGALAVYGGGGAEADFYNVFKRAACLAILITLGPV